MASPKVEIYVSKDGSNFTKLDLYKDESITIKYLRKDTQDLSKVFAPFSQGFSIEGTPKNCQALGYFGNTEIIRSFGSNILDCKIYIAGFLNNTGSLKIENVKYNKGRIANFNVSFNSSLLSLKDRIGEDTLADLSSSAVTSWSPGNVYNSLKNVQTINIDGTPLYWYTPLASNKRVLVYDADENITDNIAYKSSNNSLSDNCLSIDELRPSVSISSLFGLIKNKYNLDINIPLENRKEFNEAYIYCNGENFYNKNIGFLKLVNSFTNQNPSIATTILNPDSSLKVIKDSDTYSAFLEVGLYNIVLGSNFVKAKGKIEIIDKVSGVVLVENEIDVENGNYILSVFLPMAAFVSNELEFYIRVSFDRPVFWGETRCNIRYKNRYASPGISNSYSPGNYVFSTVESHHVNLLDAIPETKVIDFLTSIFKTFNISIFDSSVNDDKLDFLTPQDIETTNEIHGKRTVDYTRYVDIKNVDKKVLENYNYYNFQHKKGKYRSQKDYRDLFGKEYGQINYPEVKPPKAKEYKIETNFTIIPPVTINGLVNVMTFYGFTAENPTFDNNLVRYSSNTEDLTIFYKGEQSAIPALSCQNFNSSGVVVNSVLDKYIKTSPINSIGNSLSFSVIVINDTEYSDTIYSRHYAEQTERLLDPNSLEHSFTLVLPPNEIYLNENINFAPNGFRLQNDIIIGETKFDILEANIDLTSGKTKMKLLNK